VGSYVGRKQGNDERPTTRGRGTHHGGTSLPALASLSAALPAFVGFNTPEMIYNTFAQLKISCARSLLNAGPSFKKNRLGGSSCLVLSLSSKKNQKARSAREKPKKKDSVFRFGGFVGL